MLKISKDSVIQNIIGLIIIVFVGVIAWPLAPKPNAHVSGILLPVSTLKSPIASNEVQVLQAMPVYAQVIGHINTNLYYDSISLKEESQDMALSINYAKMLAAQAGANAIVINQIGITGPVDPLDGFVVRATAINY
jgi:hypothetical protein